MKRILPVLLLLFAFQAFSQPLKDKGDIENNVSAKTPDAFAINISAVVTNISCFDGVNGAINITVTGGVAPYTYSWLYNGSVVFATTEDVTGLIVGTYKVTVTDATMTTGAATFTVTEPTQIVVSLGVTQALCYGGEGTVVVSATGGTPPYTGTGTFVRYQGGWDFTVTDANGCSVTKTAYLFWPGELEAYAIAGDIPCHDGTTTVTVGANGGTPPYTGTGTFIAGPGYHYYPVTDANGCTGSFAAQVTIANPPLITASASAGTISCFGGTTTLTVTATGGHFYPKEYSLNGAAFQSGNTFTVNAAGSPYTVTVREVSTLCTGTSNIVTVTQPTQLTAGTSSTAVSTPGASDGTATAIPAGGTPGYTYSWNSSPVQTTITATGLPAGTYTVTVTDSKGCITSANVTIGAPACNLSATAVAGAIACFGGTTTLTVTATGGTAPIQYSLNGGTFQSGNTFTVGAGVYTVTVKDAVPCTVTANTVTITQPAAALSASSTNGTLACSGTTTVTVSATGGTPPYTNTGIITVTSSGTFNFTVTDANGCTAIATATVAAATGPCPTLTEMIYPKYVQGVGSGVPSADKKVPYACRIKISGLPNPNTPYRYIASFTSTPLIGDNGSGAFIDPEQSGSFVRVTSPSMASGFGTFTTDFSGNAEEWFIIEPTSVADFAPGTQLYLRIVLNSGASTPNEYYRLTASNAVTVLGFGSSPTQGTGLRSTAVSPNIAKNFIMLYDNEAGTGRPESGTFIESDGTSNGGAENYAPFYAGNVDGVNKTWGTIIPNNLSTGIRNISQLKLVDGTLENRCTSTNGTFGTAVTANTTGGLTEQVISCTGDVLPLTVTGVATNLTCFDNFSGTINITVLGGTAPYTYSWLYNGPFGTFVFATSEDVFGLSPATYTVTITDAASAVKTATFTITEPPQLVVSLDITDAPCDGSFGTVVVSATGGTPPYSGTGTFTRPEGGWDFTVTDFNGCSATKTAYIFAPSELVPYAIAGQIPCHDGTTMVTVGASGGTPPYVGTGTFIAGPGYHYYPVTDAHGCGSSFAAQVDIPNPPVITATAVAGTIACIGGTTQLTVTASGGHAYPKEYSLNGGAFQSSNIFTVDAAGSPYTVTVREQVTLCTAVSNTVAVTQSSTALTATATSTDATTPGGSDGTATAIPAGGTGPYTYSWNSIPVQTTITATGLPAGVYTVTVTDSRGCTTTATANVSSPSCTMTASAATGTINCFGGTTTLTVTAINGTAPLQYSLNGGSFQSSNTFTVSDGSYTVTVKDANGCTATATASATQPAAIVVSATNSPIPCHGGTSEVIITASNGVEPYTGTGTFTQSVGTVVYTVTDANGCIGTRSVTISEPATLTASSSGTNILCNGGTATVTVSATGGTGSYSGTGTFTRSAGSYTFTVTDANGCTSNTSITLTEPTLLVASSTPGVAVCGSNGNVVVTATGGTAPYTGTGTISTPVGTYTYTVTDANGCTATTTGEVTCSGNLPLAATIVKNDVSVCGGTNDGAIYVTATGGIPPYSYSWTGLTGSNQTPFTAGNVSSITGLNYGFYNVTVTDNALNSITISNIHVQKTFAVFVTASGTVSGSCNASGTISLYGNSGVQPYTYSLDGTTYQSGNTFTGLASGTYTGYVKDLAGCVSTKTVTVGVSSSVTISTFARPASSCANSGSIEIFRSGGVAPYTYSIDGTTYQAGSIFNNVAAGSYTAWVKDSKGCTASASVTVTAAAPITVTAGKNNSSSCVNDGSIQASASGGVYPYTYSIDGTTFQSSNTFSLLAPATYTVTAKDSKGCTGTLSVVIATNSVVVTAYASTASGCGASNGYIQLFRSGGVAPYTYSINGSSYGGSNLFTGLAHGTYTGYVKDSKGCIGTLTGIVVGPGGCPTPVATNAKGAVVPTQETKVSAKIHAYPNPSSTSFTIVLEGFSSNVPVNVMVTDLLGRTVYQETGAMKLQYKFGSKLISGLYNVQVVQGDTRKTLKLVKE